MGVGARGGEGGGGSAVEAPEPKLYVGNLPWDMPPAQLEALLRQGCQRFGKLEYVRVCTWDTPGVKRKRRDLEKLHAGHAWVRFVDRAAAAAAVGGLAAEIGVQSWPEAQAGCRVGVRVDWSRDEDPREPTAEEIAAEAARQERKESRRDHKKRFKKRQREALLQGIEAALGLLPPPGGLGALGSFTPLEALLEGPTGPLPFNWSAVPTECDPGLSIRGRMTSGGEQRTVERAHRKRLQVESFAAVLRFLLRPEVHPSGRTVVDFGCGSGALMLPLAHAFPRHHFVGVDMNPKAVELLLERAKLSGLDNVEGHVGMIETYSGRCDCALALHACGNATDYAMLKAVTARAAYVMCPCCVGKLKFSLTGGSSFSSNRDATFGEHYGSCKGQPNGEQDVQVSKETTPSIIHPRSKWMSGAVDKASFAQIAKFADISHGADATGKQVSDEHPSETLARVCKANIECDRSEFAREAGYRVGRLRLLDSGSTAKTELLVGVPSEKATSLTNFFSILASPGPAQGQQRTGEEKRGDERQGGAEQL